MSSVIRAERIYASQLSRTLYLMRQTRCGELRVPPSPFLLVCPYTSSSPHGRNGHQNGPCNARGPRLKHSRTLRSHHPHTDTEYGSPCITDSTVRSPQQAIPTCTRPIFRSVCGTFQQSNSSLAPRFYGITTLQAFMYYRDKYNDPPILKLSVSLTTTSESLNPLTTCARQVFVLWYDTSPHLPAGRSLMRIYAGSWTAYTSASSQAQCIGIVLSTSRTSLPSKDPSGPYLSVKSLSLSSWLSS